MRIDSCIQITHNVPFASLPRFPEAEPEWSPKFWKGTGFLVGVAGFGVGEAAEDEAWRPGWKDPVERL